MWTNALSANIVVIHLAISHASSFASNTTNREGLLTNRVITCKPSYVLFAHTIWCNRCPHHLEMMQRGGVERSPSKIAHCNLPWVIKTKTGKPTHRPDLTYQTPVELFVWEIPKSYKSEHSFMVRNCRMLPPIQDWDAAVKMVHREASRTAKPLRSHD